MMVYPMYYITITLIYFVIMLGGWVWLLNLIIVNIGLGSYSELNVFSIAILILGSMSVSMWFFFTIFRLIQFIPYLFTKISSLKEGIKIESRINKKEKVVFWNEINVIKKSDTISGVIVYSRYDKLLFVASVYLLNYRDILYKIKSNSKNCTFKSK